MSFSSTLSFTVIVYSQNLLKVWTRNSNNYFFVVAIINVQHLWQAIFLFDLTSLNWLQLWLSEFILLLWVTAHCTSSVLLINTGNILILAEFQIQSNQTISYLRCFVSAPSVWSVIVCYNLHPLFSYAVCMIRLLSIAVQRYLLHCSAATPVDYNFALKKQKVGIIKYVWIVPAFCMNGSW